MRNEDGHIVCPACEHNFTHAVGVAGVMTGTGGRLNAEIDMTCENCSCEWTIIFHQHRGNTSIEVVTS